MIASEGFKLNEMPQHKRNKWRASFCWKSTKPVRRLILY